MIELFELNFAKKNLFPDIQISLCWFYSLMGHLFLMRYPIVQVTKKIFRVHRDKRFFCQALYDLDVFKLCLVC